LKSQPKIVVTSKSFSNNKELISALRRKFDDISLNEDNKIHSKKDLINFLKDADAAIVGLDPIDEEVLKDCPKLKIISKYGVGLNNIDQDACKKHAIEIGWTGGVNKTSVAEMTIGFLLALARNLFFSSYQLKQGHWQKHGGFQLTGKTIGIIGCGHIGKEVVKMLKPFSCNILINDIVDLSDFCMEVGATKATKKEIYENADFISVHTPLDTSTLNLLNLEVFKACKKNPFIINSARGGIINETDLLEALEQGMIRGAALDSYVEEPLSNSKIYTHPQIITTPHIGGNAAEAVLAMGLTAISNLEELLKQDSSL
jgi:D-3-phosphoglycerate dehydrogenase